MPSIGAKIRKEDKLISIKIFGPDLDFQVTRDNLKVWLREATDNGNGVRSVARLIAEQSKFDLNVVWVECEILHKDGTTVSWPELVNA